MMNDRQPDMGNKLGRLGDIVGGSVNRGLGGAIRGTKMLTDIKHAGENLGSWLPRAQARLTDTFQALLRTRARE